MRVSCDANIGSALPARYFGRGYSQVSNFDLKIGSEYIVYGICLHQGDLLYLLLGEGHQPYWYPAELFQVNNAELPATWQFSFLGAKTDLTAVWGYDELVNDSDYYDQLSDLEQRALEIFENRRREIDSLS